MSTEHGSTDYIIIEMIPIEKEHPNEQASEIGQADLNVQWLNFWMKYFLFVGHTKRSMKCQVLIIFLNIFTIISCLGFLFAIFWDRTKNSMTSKTPLLVTVEALGYGALVLARLLSLYYYYYKFDFPWSDTILIHKNHRFIYRNYSKMLIMLLILEVTNNVADFCIPSAGINIRFNKTLSIMHYSIAFFVWWMPNVFSLIVHAVICFKYYHKLTEFSAKNALADRRLEYKTILDNYRQEYHWSLKFSVQIEIVAWVLILWIDIYDTQQLELWANAHLLDIFLWFVCDVSRVVLAAILYFISGCILNEQFIALEKKIRMDIDEYIVKNSKDDNYKDYMIMSQLGKLHTYITWYPINISIGPLTITTKNTIIFVGTFILSTYIKTLIAELSLS